MTKHVVYNLFANKKQVSIQVQYNTSFCESVYQQQTEVRRSKVVVQMTVHRYAHWIFKPNDITSVAAMTHQQKQYTTATLKRVGNFNAYLPNTSDNNSQK